MANLRIAQEAGYSHGEAFMHMKYIGQSRAGRIHLSIWNSRDGVTPFNMFCKEFGMELQHGNFSEDRFEPAYKPRKGDLIWVSYDEKSAHDYAQERWISTTEQYNELAVLTEEELRLKHPHAWRYNLKGMLEDMLKDKDKFIKTQIEDLLTAHGEPQPRLVLVQEDWI